MNRQDERIGGAWRAGLSAHAHREASRDVTRRRIAELAKYVREGRATLEDIRELDALYFEVRNWL